MRLILLLVTTLSFGLDATVAAASASYSSIASGGSHGVVASSKDLLSDVTPTLTSALLSRDDTDKEVTATDADASATSTDIEHVVSRQRGGASQKGLVTLDQGLVQALLGTVVFAAIEKATKAGLAAAQISYPAQLGACILLFLSLVLTNAVAPSTAHGIYTFLTPGAALLAKWFPVFFVPGLAMLPLSPSIGGSMDILKVVVTVIVGFVYSMTTTLLSVTTVRSLQGKSPPPTTASSSSSATKSTTVAPAKPPFSDAQWNFGLKATLLTGLTSIVATTRQQSGLATLLQMIFLLLATVTSYIGGTRLPAAIVKLVHPLVTSSLVVLAVIKGLAYVTQRDFETVLQSYKVGSLHPLHAGAGDYLLYVLGPGVVAFAVSVYGRRQLLFSNLPMVVTAMLVSSAGGLFATGAFVRLIQLGGTSGGASTSLVRLSVLARNVTMALAMALTDMIGGNVSIVAMVVCLTGIVGASYGVPLLNSMGIRDPICRGLGMGSSAQGLGVAAIANEPDAFAFASVAMILTAVAATTLVSFPVVRNALIRTTTGSLSSIPAP